MRCNDPRIVDQPTRMRPVDAEFDELARHHNHQLAVFIDGITEGRKSRSIAAGVECVTCRQYDPEWPGAYRACVVVRVLK